MRAEDVEWRYLRRGRVAHMLSKSGDRVAACGMGPFLEDWYGTGSQQEYDYCSDIPACKQCLRALGLEGDPRVGTDAGAR